MYVLRRCLVAWGGARIAEPHESRTSTVTRAQYVGGYWHFAEPISGRLRIIPDPLLRSDPPTGFLPDLAELPLDPGIEYFHQTIFVSLCFTEPYCRADRKRTPPLLARDPPTGSDGNLAGHRNP